LIKENNSTRTTQKSLRKDDGKTNLSINNVNNNKQIFKVYHQNIYGLEPKFDELVASLYPDLPDILYITEHHLNSTQIQIITSEEYSLGA
jgi:hypothetical protein